MKCVCWMAAAYWMSVSLACAQSPVPATHIKPAMVGLVAMGSLHFQDHSGESPDNNLGSLNAKAGIFDGTAINIRWSQLEPKPGVFDTKVLDKALDDVRRFNQHNPKAPLAVKLRVFTGLSAPQWVKELGGAPFVVATREGGSATMGRFWSADYIAAWRHVQSELATKYDDDPLIRETSITSCVSLGDEPFILGGIDEAMMLKMRADGYTDAAYESCLMQAPEDYAAWKKTRIDYTLNPIQLTDSGKRIADFEFPLKVMVAFRKELGARAAFQNHGLVIPVREGAKAIYAEMVKLGQPLELQMFSPQTNYWDTAITFAITQMKVDEVEVWTPSGQPGFNAISNNVLKRWSDGLKANAVAQGLAK